MKNLKSFVIISMSALFLAINACAAPIKKDGTKAVSKKESAVEMKSVLQAVSIDVEARQLTVDQGGQALAVFKYVVTNIGNKPISGIQWLNAYVNKREVVHNQDMNVELTSPLMPGHSIAINLQIPFVQIQEKFRPVFMDSQSKIDVYPLDRIIRFSDQKVLHER
ncbi:hypothetical protein BKK51_02740 [Rodentibacter trehalosifermentans]|uniref:DUF2393 domain-containing protein n=1 Tax=Rodentibacter trehalosifermentans TaxID=1908263 RepID=A0A1V3IWG0_9PAST|nr:hypothetical protein [Rodentibacter trehalosifermentans]OOF46420.1 hypothetical protein BKK51_02740 [Rodentibacter trehalosifermentans]